MASFPPASAVGGATAPQVSNNDVAAPPAIQNGHDTTAKPEGSPGLSSDEMALYDRQIRLWGAQAQERIRSAHILLVSLRALGTEIAKNLTLAGVNSLTIIDDDLVKEEDLGAQYFLRQEDVGTPRAQAAIPRIQDLNPRVNVKSDGSIQTLLGKDQNYYKAFSCVIACDQDFMTLFGINTAARLAQTPLYAASIHGFYGFIFADLVEHTYIVEREKSNVPTSVVPESVTRSVQTVSEKKENSGKLVELVQKKEVYCPLLLANTAQLPVEILRNPRRLRGVPALLPCLRALFETQRAHGHSAPRNEADLVQFANLAKTKALELQLPDRTITADFLRSFLSSVGAEIAPTAAFVGGRLSEDVINVLGGKGQPIQNFAFFDGDSMNGQIYCLYSPPPEQLGSVPTAAAFSVPFGQGPPASRMNGLGDLAAAPTAHDVGLGATIPRE